MRSRSRITVMRSTTFSTMRSASPAPPAAAASSRQAAIAPVFAGAPGQSGRARGRRLVEESLDLLLFLLVGDELRVERLGEFRAVAVWGVGPEAQRSGH